MTTSSACSSVPAFFDSTAAHTMAALRGRPSAPPPPAPAAAAAPASAGAPPRLPRLATISEVSLRVHSLHVLVNSCWSAGHPFVWPLCQAAVVAELYLGPECYWYCLPLSACADRGAQIALFAQEVCWLIEIFVGCQSYILFEFVCGLPVCFC